MIKRNAVTVSVTFWGALLAVLVGYLTFAEGPLMQGERQTAVVAVDTFLVQPLEGEAAAEAENLAAVGEAEQGANIAPPEPAPREEQTAQLHPPRTDPRERSRPPVAVSRPSPDFPDKARRDNVTGVVEAILTLTPEGRVSDVEIVSSTAPGYFEKATIKALRKWRYERERVTSASTSAHRRVKVAVTFDLRR